MKGLSLETILERVFGLTGRGHEGRIQKLEKAASVAAALGFPYAILEGGGTLPAGPTGSDYWWDMLPPNSDWTNAPAIFANATATIAAGAGTVNSGVFHGISFLAGGLYAAFKTLQIPSLNADASVKHLSAYQDGVAGPSITYTSDMIFGGNANYMTLGNGSHMELWSIDPANVPTTTTLLRTVNAEAASYGCDVNLFIVRVDQTFITL